MRGNEGGVLDEVAEGAVRDGGEGGGLCVGIASAEEREVHREKAGTDRRNRSRRCE